MEPVFEINTADLFCGGGGASTGMDKAVRKLHFRRRGVAINHWSVAVSTMRANHPNLNTLDCKIEEAIPAELVHGKVHLLWASPTCFTAGHLVTTARGQVPIEEVKVGDMVLTHKLRWRKVVRTQHRFAPSTVVAKGAGHCGITCTGSHKFWLRSSELEYIGRGRHAVRTYGDPQWMRIDRAVPNEALWCTPTRLEKLNVPDMPEPLATLKNPWWVIGRWIGDGHLGSGRHYDVSICGSHDEAHILEDALAGGSRKWVRFVKRTVTNFTLTDRETMEWMEENFGRYSHGKGLPSWCLTMPESDRRNLWDGYMSADGYVGKSRQQVSTVSKKLAISMRMLGEGLGYRVGMNLVHRPTYCIEGRSGKALDQYRLHFNGSFEGKRADVSFEEDGMSWGRVKDVSDGPRNQIVFNIEVEEDHSYVLDGIVVKNCTHFSRARGGKPKDNQMRSQPEFVITWLTQCDVDNLIVENVAEFMDWGPLNKDNTPNKKKKGMFFNAWVEHIRALGYNVIYKVLNCADYGDATTRRRFFLLASKKGLPMPKFPDPIYGDHVEGLKQWRAARECLDLSDLGKSIFGRKKSLSKNTLRRIAVGMKKFNGMDFLMDMLGVGESDNCRLKPLSEPLPTQHAGGNRFALVRPFLVELRNHKDAVSIDEPLSTVTTSGAHHMLCEPVILDHMRGGKAHSLDETLGTQCTHDRYSLLTPVLIGQQSCAAARSIDEPCPTVLTAGAIQMATPILLDDGRFLDIKIRMLKPSELAAAHSFPKDYVFTGNRCEKVKQIGNSVPVNTAAALCESMLKQYAA